MARSDAVQVTGFNPAEFDINHGLTNGGEAGKALGHGNADTTPGEKYNKQMDGNGANITTPSIPVVVEQKKPDTATLVETAPTTTLQHGVHPGHIDIAPDQPATTNPMDLHKPKPEIPHDKGIHPGHIDVAPDQPASPNPMRLHEQHTSGLSPNEVAANQILANAINSMQRSQGQVQERSLG